jgi:hypothetical protein
VSGAVKIRKRRKGRNHYNSRYKFHTNGKQGSLEAISDDRAEETEENEETTPVFRISDFGLLSDFGLRASDFFTLPSFLAALASL